MLLTRHRKPPFAQLITQGGDERLSLDRNGCNKYYVSPMRFRDVFHRASCTCSPFSELGHLAASTLYEQLGEIEFEDIREEHTQRIKALINYPGCDRFDVFFAPSGSDLCYYPLLFSRLRAPNRKIFNVVTCPEELGSGSNTAFAGKFYAGQNQFGEVTPAGTGIDPELIIDCHSFAARDATGQIVNHRDAIEACIDEHYDSHAILGNLVIGSKSGIENNTSILANTPEDVLWTVDLCQFRASRVLINGLIGMNACVMLTGSKFYHSPPFCGVLLVPKTVTATFQHPTASLIEPFASVFSAFDVPPQLQAIRRFLPSRPNYGLLLRWEAALAEMTAFAALDKSDAQRQILNWNQFTVERINASDHLELMPGQQSTNKTIVSFRVKSNDRYLEHAELTNLYAHLCSSRHTGLEGAEQILIGQPVKYGKQSFIRLAISSPDVRQFIDQGADYSNDGKLIELIEHYAGMIS